MKPPMTTEADSRSRGTGKFTLVENLQEGMEKPEPLRPIVLFISIQHQEDGVCVPGSALPLRLKCLKYQAKKYAS